MQAFGNLNESCCDTGNGEQVLPQRCSIECFTGRDSVNNAENHTRPENSWLTDLNSAESASYDSPTAPLFTFKFPRPVIRDTKLHNRQLIFEDIQASVEFILAPARQLRNMYSPPSKPTLEEERKDAEILVEVHEESNLSARFQPPWLGEEGLEDLTERWLAACDKTPQEKASSTSSYYSSEPSLTQSESASEKEDSYQQDSRTPSPIVSENEDCEVLER